MEHGGVYFAATGGAGGAAGGLRESAELVAYSELGPRPYAPGGAGPAPDSGPGLRGRGPLSERLRAPIWRDLEVKRPARQFCRSRALLAGQFFAYSTAITSRHAGVVQGELQLDLKLRAGQLLTLSPGRCVMSLPCTPGGLPGLQRDLYDALRS